MTGTLHENLWERYNLQLKDLHKQLKGGKEEQMQTKSRYEVISELEAKKRSLIREGDTLKNTLKSKEKDLKEMQRNVEDYKDDIKDFQESMKEKKETNKELIKSIDDSLNRFSKLESKKSK